MNQSKDSIKRATIKYLIKFILSIVFIILFVNNLLFGVFCYVNIEKPQAPIEINVMETPLKVPLEQVEAISNMIIHNQDMTNDFQLTLYNKYLKPLEESDINIMGAKYITADKYHDMGKDVPLVLNITKSTLDPKENVQYVSIVKPVITLNKSIIGVLVVDYRYDVFEMSILSALPNAINHERVVHVDDLKRKSEVIYEIGNSDFIIVEDYQYLTFLKTFILRQKNTMFLMLTILTISAVFFVTRNMMTINKLIEDLEQNYRKNIKGSCLINEYHVLQEKLEDIKLDIDSKLLRISELKVVENELIQELRYKTKQFDELYKNHTVLKNKAQYLSGFFSTLSNNMDQIIWITDTEGKILYANQALKDILKFDIKANKYMYMFDFIEGFDDNMGILLDRDFKSIKFTFKNQIFNESLSGSSIRISEFNRVSYLLFLCSKSNFEDKMNQNYLKKSRDLHFINEIGRIISINNNIDATLQEILDKVAFLANLNLSTIRLINENQNLEVKTISGYSTEYILNEETPIDERHIGYCFKENKIILINHEEDLLFPEPLLEKILRDGKSIAYIPLANYQKSFGVMSIISDFKFNTDYLVLLESISINVTISLEKVLLYDQLKANYFKTVEAFVTAAEIKQERFSGHSRRVARVCRLIAQRLYLNENEIDDIYIAGLLHDIGKLGFADNSLEYFFDIDDHGTMGRKMIENVGFDKEILDGIEFHHLNYDLSNQSNTLQEQPYYSQIIRLANDFDLFMNYKTGELNREQFVTKMASDSGTIYSPQLIKILEDLIENKNNFLRDIYASNIMGEKYEN